MASPSSVPSLSPAPKVTSSEASSGPTYWKWIVLVFAALSAVFVYRKWRQKQAAQQQPSPVSLSPLPSQTQSNATNLPLDTWQYAANALLTQIEQDAPLPFNTPRQHQPRPRSASLSSVTATPFSLSGVPAVPSPSAAFLPSTSSSRFNSSMSTPAPSTSTGTTSSVAPIPPSPSATSPPLRPVQCVISPLPATREQLQHIAAVCSRSQSRTGSGLSSSYVHGVYGMPSTPRSEKLYCTSPSPIRPGRLDEFFSALDVLPHDQNDMIRLKLDGVLGDKQMGPSSFAQFCQILRTNFSAIGIKAIEMYLEAVPGSIDAYKKWGFSVKNWPPHLTPKSKLTYMEYTLSLQ